jgi:hypothetical protein
VRAVGIVVRKGTPRYVPSSCHFFPPQREISPALNPFFRTRFAVYAPNAILLLEHTLITCRSQLHWLLHWQIQFNCAVDRSGRFISVAGPVGPLANIHADELLAYAESALHHLSDSALAHSLCVLCDWSVCSAECFSR